MATLRQLVLERAKQTAKLQPLTEGEGITIPYQPKQAPTPVASRPGVPSTRRAPARGVSSDLVSEVGSVASSRVPRSTAGDESTKRRYHTPGSIPKYLQKFKADKENARVQKEEEAKKVKVPEGYRLVSEDERIKTLDWFSGKLEGVAQSMSKLPIRIEIASQKKREKELVEKKNSLEEGVKLFSRKLVFVPKDSDPLFEADEADDILDPCSGEERFGDNDDFQLPGMPAKDTNDRLFGGYEEAPILQNEGYANSLNTITHHPEATGMQMPGQQMNYPPMGAMGGQNQYNPIAHQGQYQQPPGFQQQPAMMEQCPPPGLAGRGGYNQQPVGGASNASSGSFYNGYGGGAQEQDGPPGRNMQQNQIPYGSPSAFSGGGSGPSYPGPGAFVQSPPPTSNLYHGGVSSTGSRQMPGMHDIPPMVYPDMVQHSNSSSKSPHLLKMDDSERGTKWNTQNPTKITSQPMGVMSTSRPLPGVSDTTSDPDNAPRVPPGGFSSLVLY
ncbi:unnamed protein product [Amoebophrya sp. A25]|nr:unnamed protein product [Amoebophrya sp. A25]|eukprot:GSA25T00010074001.1